MSIFIYTLDATLQYEVQARTREEADRIINENDSAHQQVAMDILPDESSTIEFQYEEEE